MLLSGKVLSMQIVKISNRLRCLRTFNAKNSEQNFDSLKIPLMFPSDRSWMSRKEIISVMVIETYMTITLII